MKDIGRRNYADINEMVSRISNVKVFVSLAIVPEGRGLTIRELDVLIDVTHGSNTGC